MRAADGSWKSLAFARKRVESLTFRAGEFAGDNLRFFHPCGGREGDQSDKQAGHKNEVKNGDKNGQDHTGKKQSARLKSFSRTFTRAVLAPVDEALGGFLPALTKQSLSLNR